LLARCFSFDYVISPPVICCKWGDPIGDGNLSGLVGDLFNGYSDVGWANLYNTPDRRDYIDYTDAYKIDHAGFMVRYIYTHRPTQRIPVNRQLTVDG
jgi:hypothetical protein